MIDEIKAVGVICLEMLKDWKREIVAGYGAAYNTETGEILNCAPGSLAYRHEEGHAFAHSKASVKKLHVVVLMFAQSALMIVLFTHENLVLRVIGGAWILEMLVDEAFAWAFAFGWVKDEKKKGR